ncbi:MAG TPA: hypothetical protein VK172_10225 [Lentimicrobium sp.]|nr:hypothetical protein [Lentimicrobium sp.]
MPKMFIRVQDKKEKKEYFFEWSTIVDAPVSEVVEGKEQFKKLYHKERRGIFPSDEVYSHALVDVLERLTKRNISVPTYTRTELLSASDEFHTVKDLLKYCKENVTII